MTIKVMFPIIKRAVPSLSNGVIHTNPMYTLNKYVAAFTSMTDVTNKGPKTTRDKLINKDATVVEPEELEGSRGGFGIFSDEDETGPEGPQVGYGGSGIPNRDDKSEATLYNNETYTGEQRMREDVDTGDSAEMAKAGVVGAMETGLKIGEMAKQTVDGMWDAAKKTTENVRDAVADDHDDRSGVGDNRESIREQPSDKHVEGLKRWSRGADLKG